MLPTTREDNRDVDNISFLMQCFKRLELHNDRHTGQILCRPTYLDLMFKFRHKPVGNSVVFRQSHTALKLNSHELTLHNVGVRNTAVTMGNVGFLLFPLGACCLWQTTSLLIHSDAHVQVCAVVSPLFELSNIRWQCGFMLHSLTWELLLALYFI